MAIENLLKLFNDRKVKYVIIGATAFPIHGYARATLDTDISIEPTVENAEKCLAALMDFGYDMNQITAHDLLRKKTLIRQYLLEVDIHPFVTGVEFQEVWKRKIKGRIGKVETSFACLDDLIKMKKAADRPKDKEDLKVLLKLKETKKN
jgi:predicted nucleotidyltransferase